MACYTEALLCNKGETCLENAAKKSLKLYFYEFIQWKMDMLSLSHKSDCYKLNICSYFVWTAKIACRWKHNFSLKKKSVFEQIFVEQSFKSLFFLITDKKGARCRSSCQENQKADTPDTGEKTLLHTLSSVFGEGRLNLQRRAKYFPKNSSHRRDMWEPGFNQNYNLT